MADLCDPSNSLQSFQKHAAVDRSLQQDRWNQRTSPSQGFRSEQNFSLGTIEQDFHAFQTQEPMLEVLGVTPQILPLPFNPYASLSPQNHVSKTPALPLNPYDSMQNREFYQNQQQNLYDSSSPPAWVNDYTTSFQNLNISSSAPAQHLQRPQFENDQHQIQYNHSNQYTWPSSGPSYLETQANNHSLIVSSGGEGVTSVMNINNNFSRQFDEEAWARSYCEAESRTKTIVRKEPTAWQLAASEGRIENVRSAFTSDQLPKPEDVTDLHLATSILALQDKLGSDTISPSTHKDSKIAPDPSAQKIINDELAYTASLMLHNLAHKVDTDPKFRDSEFLKLMRQFRDGEVEVQIDKIVPSKNNGTSSESLAVATNGKVEYESFEQSDSFSVPVELTSPGTTDIVDAAITQIQI